MNLVHQFIGEKINNNNLLKVVDFRNKEKAIIFHRIRKNKVADFQSKEKAIIIRHIQKNKAADFQNKEKIHFRLFEIKEKIHFKVMIF